MKMLIAIDGAGDILESEEAYATRYGDSWTKRLFDLASELSHYFQAERVITGDVFIQGMNVAGWVIENTSPEDEIAFVGYNRGGASCIIAASQISNNVLFGQTRNVVALGLFDPVANQFDGDYHCCHAGLDHTAVYLARSSTNSPFFPPVELNIPNLQTRLFEGEHADLGGYVSTTGSDAYNWIGSFLDDCGFVNFSAM